MSEQIILSTSYGTALADSAVPCVITQWHGFANKTEFIALQDAALVYFEQQATAERPWGWIGDVRHMGAIPEEAQRWLQNEFNPRALAAGLRVVSVVVAESIFGQIATQRYEQQTATSTSVLGVTYYTSLEEAKAGAQQEARARWKSIF
ncbi:hypothetical protein KLP40_19460 [Hymenobacter sp. NST-14]|uniref:hypothetical protein n=1 Tax=Hymenobacter piscis TaxID=2839984 RepID=UPI001C02A8AB|nr:hypothetical protein [Hymenobacter piscis]MBT9395354.1 hypothetical protein [Hymenobacter piscis]